MTGLQRAALDGRYLYKLARYYRGAYIILFLKKLSSHVYLSLYYLVNTLESLYISILHKRYNISIEKLINPQLFMVFFNYRR